VAKLKPNNNNTAEEYRNTREVNFIRSMLAPLPLVYSQPDYSGHKPISKRCDVFDFVQKNSEYRLIMLVSIDETKDSEKYICLHFRGDVSILESLFDSEMNSKRKFEQFMDMSRDRLKEAKSRVKQKSQQHGIYGEYESFAAYDVGEKIEWKEKTQTIEKCFKDIHPEIKDIVVYEHPFTKIGRRSCGALYLVFVDTVDLRKEKKERERHLFGSSILYRSLAETNSNIWIATRLEAMSFKDRIVELQKQGTCDSYIRAVKKLAVMRLFENFGKMVSTLAEIQYYGHTAYMWEGKVYEWKNFDPTVETLEKFNIKLGNYINNKIEEYYLAEFKFTSESKYLIDSDGKNLFDTRALHKTKVDELKAKVAESKKIVDTLKKEVEKCSTIEELKEKIGENQTLAEELKAAVDEPKTEVDERKEMVHLMWKTSYFLSEVMILSDYYHGVTDSNEIKSDTVDARIEYIRSETMKLLDFVPGIVWKASNELSTQKNGELKLDSPVLVLFLATKYAEWKKNGDIAEDSLLGGCRKTANCEKLMLLKHLLHVIQYVLRIRDDRDAEVLRSVIWLISEFGHTALNINRHIDIEHNLLLLAQQQPALFGLKDHYRDHMNHVIQVCLTGWLLLETRLGVHRLYESFPTLKGTDDNSPATNKDNSEWFKNILAKWFVASLLHDVGYITSIGDGWMKLLGSFRTKSLDSVQKEMRESLKYSINRHLHKRSQDFLPKEPDYEDHGVVSALHISELIHAIDSEKPEKYEEYFSTFHAVAFHNKSKECIVYVDDPLTVLLVICDEIQEWGRPTVDKNNLSLNLAINSQQENECWYDSIESLSVNIKTDYDGMKEQLRLSLINDDPLRCTIKYKDTIYRNNSIFNVWLARSESVQRLNLKQSPLMGFSFKIESKIWENNNVHNFRKNETHMERLKRFIREKHYWKLFRWLQCAEYHKDGDYEVVTLDVDNLYEKKPVEGGMEEFWKAFSAWKDNGQPF